MNYDESYNSHQGECWESVHHTSITMWSKAVLSWC